VAAQRVLAVLCLERVDVDGAIRRLGRDELVEGVPRHTLDIVAVFGDLTDETSCAIVVLAAIPRGGRVACLGRHLTRGGTVDPSDIVHAPDDEVGAVGRPCQVVDLGA